MDFSEKSENESSAATHAANGRMAADERRQQILQVAIKLFSQKGFSGTTTKEIARAAGVSEAMVFRHYATKNDLYDAILQYATCGENDCDSLFLKHNETFRRFYEAGDDRNFFYYFALHTLQHHKNDVELIRLLFHSALEGHELADKFFEKFITPTYEFLSSYIRRRQAAGAMREIDPPVAVRSFLGMLIHHSLNNLLWDAKHRLLNITDEDAARQFSEILLNGVALKKNEI